MEIKFIASSQMAMNILIFAENVIFLKLCVEHHM